ncbi:MAG: hypothetical protein IJA92_06260, partial [Oscillospiraceae bacterium]|nr:hypothetical protein [Oscillospiraceae bacterium]
NGCKYQTKITFAARNILSTKGTPRGVPFVLKIFRAAKVIFVWYLQPFLILLLNFTNNLI